MPRVLLLILSGMILATCGPQPGPPRNVPIVDPADAVRIILNPVQTEEEKKDPPMKYPDTKGEEATSDAAVGSTLEGNKKK